MISTLENFDWSITNRKLVIFMPNFGRGEYVRKTVQTISTTIPREDWLVVAINDRVHEDLSGLEENYNTVYLTFGPERSKEARGDAFMRNVIIKRCQSEWLFQKDPEIVVHNDFIKHILECQTDMYRLSGPASKVRQATTQKFLQDQATIQECIQDSDKYTINEKQFVYFHFGFAVKTAILKNMRGYDEDYKKMYCADKDLYARLMASGVRPTFDAKCKPIHLWHTVPWYPDNPENKADYARMKAIFASKDPKQTIRNDEHSWGEGD
jgi:hypothetical protein